MEKVERRGGNALFDPRSLSSPAPQVDKENSGDLIHYTLYVDFERSSSEEWNKYEFSDGTIYRVKIEPTTVMRTDKFAPDGDPYYLISSGTIPRIKIPPNLMKKQIPRISFSPQKEEIYK